MERTGRVPICLQGIQFHVNPASKHNSAPKHVVEDKERHNNHPDTASVEKDNQQLTTPQHANLYASALGLGALMQKGMTRQWNQMGKVFRQTVHQLPQRMFK
jgi:hypothetical protein